MLLMVVITLFAGGLMLLEVGHAAIVRAEATTIADAAALAAADNMADQMREALSATGLNEAIALDTGAIAAAARTYAARNGGRVTVISISAEELTVTVEAATDDALRGEVLESVAGRRGAASASAEVVVAYAFGAPGAPVSTASPDELEQILGAGVTVPSYSVLLDPRSYGTGNGGASVNLLAPQMKVSIAKLETLIGQKLIVNSGYRTTAYQARLCRRVTGPCAPPGRSMHQYGLAVDVANYRAALPYLTAVGLCQPLPSNDAWHLSHVSGRECGSRAGVLGNAAFGGDPVSYATYEVRLTQ